MSYSGPTPARADGESHHPEQPPSLNSPQRCYRNSFGRRYAKGCEGVGVSAIYLGALLYGTPQACTQAGVSASLRSRAAEVIAPR